MTNEEKLSKALNEFKTKYPNVSSGDLQTFVIGWQESLKCCSETNSQKSSNQLINSDSPIILENLSDEELLKLVDESGKDTYDENSTIRALAKQYFGGNNLTQIMLVDKILLPIVAERMRCYSPHIIK